MIFTGTAQQTDGSRESEGVWTKASLNLDAGLIEPMRDDTMHRITSAKRAERRPRMQEDLAEFGLGPSPAQIVQQRIADNRLAIEEAATLGAPVLVIVSGPPEGQTLIDARASLRGLGAAR